MSFSLMQVARAFGDSRGHIVLRSESGQPMSLALGQQDLEFYTAGDNVHRDDVFALCIEDERPGPSSCVELDLAADDDGGATQFECHPDAESGNWCECTGVYDCIHMSRLAVCNEDMTCDESGCACTSD